MDGKGVRQAAREQIKGRRGFLLLAVVLSNLLTVFTAVILPRMRFVVPQAVSWPVSLLCGLLGLGVIKIALEQAESAPKSLQSLFFCFNKGIFLNALILLLILGLFNLLVSTATTGLGLVGTLLFSLAAMFLELLFFPIRYRFVLCPGRPLPEHLKKGIKLGTRWCGDVFVFHFWLYGPVMLAYVLFLMLTVFSRGVLMAIFVLFLLLIVGIIAFFWYLPYATLAQAMFARELILDEEWVAPPPPSKKRMKLVKKDGWCRVDTKTGRGGKNLIVKKDGEAIERK